MRRLVLRSSSFHTGGDAQHIRSRVGEAGNSWLFVRQATAGIGQSSLYAVLAEKQINKQCDIVRVQRRGYIGRRGCMMGRRAGEICDGSLTATLTDMVSSESMRGRAVQVSETTSGCWTGTAGRLGE